MGKSRTAALDAMRDRLSDDEIGSLIGAIIQGEQLGTPLALLFRAQADVLRLKRTQRAETIAGEAAVKMLFPAVLIMVATVIIMLGPFILGLMTDDWLAGDVGSGFPVPADRASRWCLASKPASKSKTLVGPGSARRAFRAHDACRLRAGCSSGLCSYLTRRLDAAAAGCVRTDRST